MKTTNFEISKQLKEAGFDAETDFYWYCNDNKQEIRRIADANGKDNIKSYDFKTILDALPMYIMKEYKDKLNDKFIKYIAELTISKHLHNSYIIEYRCYDIVTQLEDTNVYYDRIFSCFTKYDIVPNLENYNQIFSCFTENESLADTAGSMWLKIKENKCLCMYHR